jgi:hypothetical protein
MALTTKNYGNTVRGEYSNVKDTFPASVDAASVAAGQVATVDTLVGGTGYTTSSVETATTTSGSGTGMTVTYTAVAGAVTAVTIVNPGTGYAVNDTQTITAGNTDATFDVATLGDLISSVNNLEKIVGTFTSFTTDCQPGDYIWFTTTDELVEIRNIVDDTNLTLAAAVPTSVTDVAWKIVRKSDNGFNRVSWVIDSVGAASINEIAYPASTSETLGDTQPNGQGGGRRIAPIIVDSTANSNVVYVTGE